MRTKQLVSGLNNSQSIRVIINGVGFYTTVAGMNNLCFTNQRVVVSDALERIVREKVQGFASTKVFYNEQGVADKIDFQVDLL